MSYDNNPRDPRQKESTINEVEPDMTPRREGGDDSLAESSPIDTRSDEKVIVNEQRSDRAVNTPSQTAPHTSEGQSYDDDIIDPVQNSDE